MTHDDYIGRCKGLVISVAGSLPAEDVGWAMRLIDHGEPAEGLTSLAWSLETASGAVAGDVASAIIELIDGLVPKESLPPSVQAVAAEAEDEGPSPCARE